MIIRAKDTRIVAVGKNSEFKLLSDSTALAGMTGAGTEFMNALCKRAKERGISEEELGAKMAYVLADAMLAERSKP